MPAEKIFATFQPQAWQNDYAVEAGDSVEVDVTVQVLEMSMSEIRQLRNDDYPSDHLCQEQSANHSGPFCVNVADEICDFFDVGNLNEITDDMLNAARTRLRIGMEREFEVTLSRTTTRTATIKVRSTSGYRAREAALDQSGDVDFHQFAESEPEFEVQSVQEVPEAGQRARPR